MNKNLETLRFELSFYASLNSACQGRSLRRRLPHSMKDGNQPMNVNLHP